VSFQGHKKTPSNEDYLGFFYALGNVNFDNNSTPLFLGICASAFSTFSTLHSRRYSFNVKSNEVTDITQEAITRAPPALLQPLGHAMLKILILTLFVTTTAYANKNQVEIGVDFKAYDYTPLAEGYQGDLFSKPTTFNFIKGSTPAYLFKLPTYGSDHTMEISSEIKNQEFFYPIFLVLDKDFEVTRTIQDKLRIQNIGLYKNGFKSELLVKPGDNYLVIMTSPALIGKTLAFNTQSTSYIPANPSGTIYVPGPTSYQIEEALFSYTPSVKLRVPVAGNYSPIKRHTGWYFDLGATSGGDKVATNTTIDPLSGDNGDPYNAGGGAIFGFGYSHPISAYYNLVGRSYAGLRYQGGEGTNQGVILQASLLFTQKVFNVGIGLYGDINNSVEFPNGKKAEFKDTFGPSLFVEYRASDNFLFGLRVVSLDYQSKEDVDYSGDQAGIYMTLEL